MEEKEIICKDCKKPFIVKSSARFKRRYCEKCSKERKDYYNNLHTIKIEDCEDD